MAQIDVTKLSPVDIGTGGVLGVKDGGVALVNKTSLIEGLARTEDFLSIQGAGLVRTSDGKKVQEYLDYLNTKIDRQERSIFSFMTDAQIADVVSGTNALDLASVFSAAKAWAVSVGRATRITFPGYKYVASAFPNWNVNFLELNFVGMPEWKSTGTGVILNIDASGQGFVYGVKTNGQITVTGNPNTPNAYRIVKTAHSIFGKIRARECTVSGGTILLGVLCVFDTPTCSTNVDPGMVTKPAVGLTIGAAEGLNTTACILINPIHEGTPQGLVFNNADWCVVESGTSEGCTIRGVGILPGCRGIQLINHCCEANGSEDVSDFGNKTMIQGGYYTKSIKSAASKQLTITDVYVHSIFLSTTCVAPIIERIHYNAFPGHNAGATGVISIPTDIVQPTYGNNWDEQSNQLDRFGIRRWMNPITAASGQTVGATPWIYTNSTQYWQQIIIRGGTISRIDFIRNGIDTIVGGSGTLPTNGVYLLAPTDQLRLFYTVAPDFIRVPM